MQKSNVLNKIIDIIKTYCPVDNLDLDKNIFSEDINCNSRDLVCIFLDIEKTFNLDLNQLIKLLNYVSVNKLTTAILSLKK